MRFLVTGGAGFIGSHLVDRILVEGHEVTVLDNFASGKRSHLDEAANTGRLRLLEGSVLDEAALDAAMEGVEIVYHLAVECVRLSIGQPVSNHEVNATGTLMTLEAARRRQVARFVYCSSSEVYGNSSSGALAEDTSVCAPTTVYGGAKLAGELYTLAYLRTYGMPTCVVRPFNAFGPREHDQGVLAEVIPRFAIRVLNGLSPVVFGDGTQGRDFTYVTDTVEGLWRVHERDQMVGATVNLGWGRCISIRSVAETILAESGRNDLSIEFAGERPGDIQALMADTAKARRVIGFEPKIDFVDGIRRYLSWFRRTYPDVRPLLEQKIENWKIPGRHVVRAE